VRGEFAIIGLSKRLEEVHRPGDSDPYHIAKQSASLQLIQRIRDEAHRFALELQRKQRKRKMLHSELLEIAGIGPKTVKKLISSFGSVRRIKQADEASLSEVVGKRLAARVNTHFSTGTES